MKIRHILLVSILLLWGLPLWAAEEQTIRIGYIEFPPIFSTNEQGEAEGVLIDLADMVLSRAGYRWEAISLPTPRMVKHLVEGELDLWIGLATLPAFEDTTLVGESVVTTIELRAYSIGEKPPINSKEDLRGKSIILLAGYSYGGWIEFISDSANEITFFNAQTHRAAFQMLLRERADYVLDYTHPVNTVLETLSVPDLQSTTLSSFGVHFVVSKKMPGAQQFLETVEASYKQLVEDGTWQP